MRHNLFSMISDGLILTRNELRLPIDHRHLSPTDHLDSVLHCMKDGMRN
jgi:hypothetical protein